jgi:hypothetical protein
MMPTTRESVSNVLTRWTAAVWLALGVAWVWWRASRDSDFAATGEIWPRYHLWFLVVTAALVASGIALVSMKATSGHAGWKRFAVTVLIGTACLVLAGLEIIDMVHGCRITYEGIFVP